MAGYLYKFPEEAQKQFLLWISLEDGERLRLSTLRARGPSTQHQRALGVFHGASLRVSTTVCHHQCA